MGGVTADDESYRDRDKERCKEEDAARNE